MTTTTSAPKTNHAPKTVKPLIPPDEQFWQRYSPHHEFPLSAMASFTAHALAFIAIIVGVYLIAKFGFGDKTPLAVQPIIVSGGGGGHKSGVDKGPGDLLDPNEVGAQKADEGKVVPPSVELKDLPKVQVAPNQLPELQNSEEGRLILKEGVQALQGLAKLNDKARQQMMEGLVSGKGEGGPGKEGGKDSGTDKGQGDGVGEGTGRLNTRTKRVLRWTMMFNTNDGADYLRQLAGLNAYIAVPEGDGQYRIYKNLSRRPIKGDVEDLKAISRIFWVDDKPDSVGSLTTAMGLPERPAHIVAFFPVELETDLLRKERNWRGLREEQIGETRFQVVRSGRTYVAVVVDQVPAQAQR